MEHLGFIQPPTTLRIFANRSNPPHLWYTIQDEEVVGLPTTALRAYLKEIRFEQKERRGKPVVKLEIHMMGDRPYIIESGYDSQFSKGFLAAIATLTHEQLEQPITLSVYGGEDEAVLFCRVYLGSEPVKATYSDKTNWRQIATAALDTVRAA